MHTHSQKRRSLALTIAFILTFSLLLAACGHPSGNTPDVNGTNNQHPSENVSENHVAPSTNNRTFTDALGHSVTIPANPKRIIAPYLEDHLLSLGIQPAAQWTVANGKQEYLQSAGLEGIPTINYDLPLEEVLSFEPDLILIGSEGLVGKGKYEQYSKIAPTFVLGDKLTQDWRKTLLKIGELLNREEQAKHVLAEYDAKVAETKEKIGPILDGKKVAVLWLIQKSFYTVSPQVASGAVLYGDLGLQPPALVTEIGEYAQASWNPVSLEKLAELDADYIFLVNSNSPGNKEMLEAPVWQHLPAVKENRVYEISSDSSWLYSGAIAGQQVMDDLVRLLNQ